MALQCSKIEKTVQLQLCALNAKINKLIHGCSVRKKIQIMFQNV